MYRSRTKEELREALQRLIHTVYRQPNTPACFTIPVDPEHDADSILSDGITELEQLRTRHVYRENLELHRIVEAFCYLVNMDDVPITDKQFPETFRVRRDELLKQVAAFFSEEEKPAKADGMEEIVRVSEELGLYDQECRTPESLSQE